MVLESLLLHYSIWQWIVQSRTQASVGFMDYHSDVVRQRFIERGGQQMRKDGVACLVYCKMI